MDAVKLEVAAVRELANRLTSGLAELKRPCFVKLLAAIRRPAVPA